MSMQNEENATPREWEMLDRLSDLFRENVPVSVVLANGVVIGGAYVCAVRNYNDLACAFSDRKYRGTMFVHTTAFQIVSIIKE